MTPLREMQLVTAHREGDADAMGQLLQAYQQRVYSICYRMVRHADDARDLTQDTLVKVLENLHQYDGRAKLSTWVIRITINSCISHLRKAKRRRTSSLDAASPEDAFNGASMAGAVAESERGSMELSGPERVERDESRQLLHQAMQSLDPEARAVLVLRDMQGLEYEQLATALDVPIGTVKSRLFRARVALRNALEQLSAQ
jgi:RNA polymerase sigma-70 factor (ECF subfamily)